MKSKVWIVAVLFVIGVVGAVAIARSSQSSDAGEWNASGFIEADVIVIAPEIAGRVVARPVSESDAVQQGDVLLKIEDDILSAQVELAQGQLAEANDLASQRASRVHCQGRSAVEVGTGRSGGGPSGVARRANCSR
jgi:multidrug resistance efflux pump